MSTEMEELLTFLSSPSRQIKKAAVGIVEGLTGSEDGLQCLAKYPELAFSQLFHLLDENRDVAVPAAKALVNLSQITDLAARMIAMGMTGKVMDILYRHKFGIARLLVMLLANLTQLDGGITSLLQVDNSGLQGLYVTKLVRSFCQSSHEPNNDDPFEHVGSILVNVSKQESGRKLLLEPRRRLLKQIIRQYDSRSRPRRKGVSGTIRNCCFEAETQLQNLLMGSEFLWPALLLPVAGKKIYPQEEISGMPLELATVLSIEREGVDDTEVRVDALESIYLIVLREAGRRAFWSVNGPRILQVGYEDEEDPKVIEAYERVGSLLAECSGVE